MAKLIGSGNEDRVIKELAIGTPMKDIAAEVGVSKMAISKFGKREEVKSKIESEQMSLLEVLPDAVNNVKDIVKGYKELDKDDHRGRKLAYDASFDVLKAVGIMPSPIPSQVIMNIYNEKPLINPVIMGLLDDRDKKFKLIEEGEVIDAEKG